MCSVKLTLANKQRYYIHVSENPHPKSQDRSALDFKYF